MQLFHSNEIIAAIVGRSENHDNVVRLGEHLDRFAKALAGTVGLSESIRQTATKPTEKRSSVAWISRSPKSPSRWGIS